MEVDISSFLGVKMTQEKPLFGGAFSCSFLENAIDISEVREIPDNQEVFAHKTTDQSLMVDILEYQSHVTGADAARYHFEDIAGVNDAENESEISSIERIPSNAHALDCDEVWILTGRQMVAKFKEKSSAKNLIRIHLALFRLSKYQTDLLIIMNTPVAISKESSSSEASSPNCPEAWTEENFKQITCTFKLNDPNIFGEE